jgi:type VI secretion system protein ImpF
VSDAARIVLSLFDRLTDDNPKSNVDPPRNEWDQLAALKRGVARDLTALLNTRINEADFPDTYDQLRRSVAAYGVHDYTHTPVELEEVRKSIERAVKTFEPRLTRVQVRVAKEVNAVDVALSFQITAQLKADLGAEPVVFDAELPKPTRRFQVDERR